MDSSDIFWNLFSLVFIGLAYFSALVLMIGLLSKLVSYLRTPMPLPHALTPAPVTEGNAILRVLGEVGIFQSLFKADKLLWAGAWLFHAALLAILFRHLRYFTYPVPGLVLGMEPVAIFFGLLFLGMGLFLLWRRLGLPRTVYISNLPDYFALALLGLIAGTGLCVSYWLHANLVEVKAFIMGLMTLHPVPVPRHPLFLFHMLLVMTLMVYFPSSKLLHAGGIFFSPSRHQPYQIQQRGKRYVNRTEH